MVEGSIIFNVFFMLGGIAVLMFGMRVMGSNLEQIAGNNMKKLLGKMTSNRFAGVGVGAAVTAIINSSTATTVMIVGFVNVGLMTLYQATSVIMGANIGTTITSLILALTGSGLEIEAIAAFIAAIGMSFILFFKKDKVVKIGHILLGIGFIFIGLKIMGKSVHEIIYYEGTLRPIFVDLFQGDVFPLLLILIGIILTALVHSSAAITGILIALGAAMRFQSAVFIILGSNIGTCITSLVSSMGTNTNAKRTALIHLLFNLFGCLLFIAPLWIWQDWFANIMTSISGGSPEWRIALFHMFFNLLTTAILLPFSNCLVFLAKKIIHEKKNGQEEKHRLTFIDNRLLETPPIAAINTKKEIIKMAGIAKENIDLSVDMLLTGNLEQSELLKDNEEALNFLNRSITAFLTKLMGKELTAHDDKAIGSYYHVVSDIERIGDYAENVMEYAVRLKKDDMDFSDDAKEELSKMREDLDLLYEKSLKVFDTLDMTGLKEVDEIEQRIDDASVELEGRHIDRVKKGTCSAGLGSIYLQTISNLERVGDHMTNIAFSVKNYRHR